jgi:hypothetical protein
VNDMATQEPSTVDEHYLIFFDGVARRDARLWALSAAESGAAESGVDRNHEFNGFNGGGSVSRLPGPAVGSWAERAPWHASNGSVPGADRLHFRPVMAPPVEGGGARYPGQGVGGGGAGRPNAIRIATGAPIGAQACSPPKPFKQPSAMSAGSSVVPQMSKASTTSLATSIGNGALASQVLKAKLPVLLRRARFPRPCDVPVRAVCFCGRACRAAV